MRRFIGVIVALVMSISTNAQSDVDPMQYFGKGQILPASLDSGKLVSVRVGTSTTNGSFRNVFEPKRQSVYSVKAVGRTAIKDNLSAGGEFVYKYYDRREQCWSMLTFAQSNPFFLADNQPGNQVSEFYALKGNILYKPIDGLFRMGGECHFLAASTAKQKDIRNKNVYSSYTIRPMLGMKIRKSVVMLAYGYSSVAEDVSISRFGNDKTIWINSVEALWFGQRQPYSSAQFPSHRYDQKRHSGLLNLEYDNGDFSLNGELLLYGGESEVRQRTEDKRVGFTHDKGVRGLLSVQLSRHKLSVELSSNAVVGFKPIQRREYNGNAYHYVQYGKVRRSESAHGDVLISYRKQQESGYWGLSFGQCTKTDRMLFYPTKFSSRRSNVSLHANGALFLPLYNQLLTTKLNLKYVIDTSDNEMLTNIHILPQGYYFEQAAMQAQYEYETSDYIAISPHLSWLMKSKGHLLVSLQIGYEGRFSVGKHSGHSRHGVDVGLKFNM